MKFVNLTPHVINIFAAKGGATPALILPPSGNIVRLSSSREKTDEMEGVPFFGVRFGALEGVPDLASLEPESVLIVSAMAKEPLREYIRDLRDAPDEEGDGSPIPPLSVVSPGELIRNGEGQPIGCHGLDW